MGFQTYPSKGEEIYIAHLQTIAGVKFTLREIDIISCILHNRGAKKIGILLNISSRTVTTHISRIMSKLQNNSRDHIIDLIEKSGNLSHLRLYYFNLLTEAAFSKMLGSIRKFFSNSAIIYSIDFHSSSESAGILASQITKYLSLANIHITTPHSTNPTNYHLYIADRAYNVDFSENNTIVLLLNQYENAQHNNGVVKYLDFTSKDNFYFSIIQLIENIIDRQELQKVVQEFKVEYKSIQDSWDGGILNDPSHLNYAPAINFKPFLKIGSVMTGIILLISIACWKFGYRWQFHRFIQLSTSENALENDPDIKLFLSVARNNDFSADNIRKEQMHKNYNLVKQIARILDYIEDTKIQSYLYSSSISPEILLDVAHNLHALSIYYMYNEHDGNKARKILLYAQNLLEHHISNHSNVEFNFDSLTKEEIYAELSIIRDLPEMYARVMYALGRTYIYQGNKKDSLKYFEISKYIGHQTGLFEEYLSITSGLQVIKKVEIDTHIKNGRYSEARNKLHGSIALYKKLKSTSVPYKLDYKPNAKIHNTIDPSKDLYNQVTLGERIIKYYAILITITDEQAQKSEYLQEILHQLCGEKGNLGILEQSKNISHRKAAQLYNTVGNIILTLYSIFPNTDLKQLQKAIKKLDLIGSDNMVELAYQIFNLSASISRNTDFTKPDAYDGMIKVYQTKIDSAPLTNEQANEIHAKILDLQTKRDQINNALKRTVE